jgi:hypothetical protein
MVERIRKGGHQLKWTRSLKRTLFATDKLTAVTGEPPGECLPESPKDGGMPPSSSLLRERR